MPTVQVTTWDEFVTQFRNSQGTSSDPLVIEIMADLDAQSSISGSGTTAINAPSNTYKSINGNFHNIRNIALSQEGSNTYILGGGTHVVYNKCNFINIFRSSPNPIFYSSIDNTTRFLDCTFQGQGGALAGVGGANPYGSGTYIRCAINWKQKTGSEIKLSFSQASFQYSYIDVELNGTAPALYNGRTFGSLQSSYVKGKINSSSTQSDCLSNSIVDSVVNIETSLNYPSGLYSSSSAPSSVSVYNTSKLTGQIMEKTNVKGVTDAQLKDAAYLSSVGFNIVT